MNELENAIMGFFIDDFNRPKKTPRHESALQIMLEDQYSEGKVKNALEGLERDEILGTIKTEVRHVGLAKFYYSKKLDSEYIKSEIPEKVVKTAQLIGKYSDIKKTRMLGEHLHFLVKSELRAHQFDIVNEKNVRGYEFREWSRTRHSLDIIAKHKTRDLVIGVEIKNMLTQPDKDEIITKLDMCEYLGIRPVFACRWMEPLRKDIENRNGLLWQFKKQLYPLGQEKFVAEIKKRLQLPVEVRAELSTEATEKFKEFIGNTK